MYLIERDTQWSCATQYYFTWVAAQFQFSRSPYDYGTTALRIPKITGSISSPQFSFSERTNERTNNRPTDRPFVAECELELNWTELKPPTKRRSSPAATTRCDNSSSNNNSNNTSKITRCETMAHSGHTPTENSPFSWWIMLKVLCATRYVYESKLFINNKSILRGIFNLTAQWSKS